jgi:hypothetical protein
VEVWGGARMTAFARRILFVATSLVVRVLSLSFSTTPSSHMVVCGDEALSLLQKWKPISVNGQVLNEKAASRFCKARIILEERGAFAVLQLSAASDAPFNLFVFSKKRNPYILETILWSVWKEDPSDPTSVRLVNDLSEWMHDTLYVETE